MAAMEKWKLTCVLICALGIASSLIAGSDSQDANREISSSVAAAGTAAPRTKIIPFQGRLTDLSEVPLSGQHDLLFSLYLAADAVSPIWQELHSAVEIVDGRFSVLLGKTTLLDDPDGNPSTVDAVDFSVSVYVGVKVGTGTEMRPRKQIVPAVHAFRADSAGHADTAGDATHSLQADRGGGIAGQIIAWAGPTNRIPLGWMVCDGSSVPIAQFQNLYDAIGNGWGCGNDGICNGQSDTNFHLPDLRGRFLRGVNLGAPEDVGGISTRDTDASSRIAIKPVSGGGNTGDAVGTIQGDNFKSHNHAVQDPGHSHGIATWQCGGPFGNLQKVGTNTAAGCQDNHQTNTITTGISINFQGGSETRSKNAAVHFIIRY